MIVENPEKDQLDHYASDFADYSIYQTVAYQRVRADIDRQDISRFVIKDESDKVAIMGLVRIRHVKPLNFRIGYVQWGPLVRKKNGNLSCSVEALKKLQEIYVGNQVNVLRLVPNVHKNQMGLKLACMLEKSGFCCVNSFTPYRTMILRLNCSEKELRGRLHQSWRRKLRKAESAGIKLREQNDRESLRMLEKLYLETARRKGFKGLRPNEFGETQSMLSAEEKMRANVAYHNGEAVTVHLTSSLGDTATLLLAASSEKGLACGAAYLSWWQAIVSANRGGMKSYDVGGINFKNNPTVSRFKSGLGGDESVHIGAFEACSSSYAKSTWRILEKGYGMLRSR